MRCWGLSVTHSVIRSRNLPCSAGDRRASSPRGVSMPDWMSAAAALVWGTIAGALVYLVATWGLLPDRPDARLWRATPAGLRAVLGYGLPAAGGLLLAKLIFDIDYLIVGRVLGAEALGYYTIAFRIPDSVRSFQLKRPRR